MKKRSFFVVIKKVLYFFVFCVMLFAFSLLFRASMIVYPFSETNSTYVMKLDGDTYILKFSKQNYVTLYRHNENKFYYQSDYKYSGEYYNQVFGNLHFYPDISRNFFNNFSSYDDSNEMHARLRLVRAKPDYFKWSANLFHDTQVPFFVEIIVTSDGIIIDGYKFHSPNIAEMEEAKKYIEDIESDWW